MSTDTDILLCAVCGDNRDVRNHYGIISCPGCKAFFRRAIADSKNYDCAKNGNCIIDMATRNHCKACRLEKCKKVGMKETELRDSRIKNGPQQTIEKVPKTVSLIPSDEQKGLNINLLNFLVETTKLVDDNYDSRYTFVTKEEIIVMDQHYGRNVSLEDGIRRPELVAPRTKNRFTFERILRGEDMSYYWYRVFVYIADYANSIPQFRMLSIEDQCQLFRHNFGFIVWVAYYHHYKNVDISNGWPVGSGAYLPVDGFPDYGPKRPDLPNTQNIMSRFASLLSDPYKELEVDMHELCFIKTILLFQFEENLSSQGFYAGG